MTAGAFSTTEETSAIRHWRAYGLALLPLALLGIMPVWTCLALCLVYALGVRSPMWAQLRLMLTLLLTAITAIAGFPVALQGGLATLVVLAVSYIISTLAGVALNLGAQTLQDGGRRGLWPVLVTGLLAPQPLLLLALAGGLAARPGPDDRRPDRVQDRRVWSWGVAALVAGLLVATALPQANSSWLTSRLAGNPGAAGSDAPQGRPQTTAPDASGAASSAIEDVAEKPFELRLETSRLLTPLTFLSFAGALLALGLALLLRPTLRGSGQRRHPAEVLMALSLLLTGAVWLVVAVLLNPGGDATGAGGMDVFEKLGRMADSMSRATPARSLDLTRVMQFQLWLALAFTALLLVAVVARLRRGFGTVGSQSKPFPDDDAGATMPAAQQEALHRVRIAYRQAEEALSFSGRGRGPAETPAGYAARLGARDPVMAGALTTLASAYEPVRYGGRVTEEDADQAEAAVAELTRALSTLPQLGPDDLTDLPPELPTNSKESL
ncbi:hypothetical protein GCM10008955_06030 [Deinococcus malanensis]|uniref:Protein-glutamine gamma-glutamyltransferase-like C-terminal domain-containing protein n=2 Tax=Deinococcus malanensis TaxID=1706855 RepID=A0ABQ2EPF3_9DEIO|nr:hypothetical protein GCM10008955_06030 [Deinococcus malanensis]